MIEIFSVVVAGLAIIAAGGTVLYVNYQSTSRPGTTKTLKFKFQYDVVYVNLIEDENGNRTMTHTSSTNWSKEQIYLKIERQRTGVYNQILKWMSYDTDQYPDVSDVYGVCYE
jgi:hypothetical protein